MVDRHDIDNVVDEQGWRLALLLLTGFRDLVDEAHRRLAEHGHPDARPLHGFALQAIGDGATAAELGRRLGVSKQAAAKTVGRLEAEGYVERSADPADARRVLVTPTERGHDLLEQSAIAFAAGLRGWRERVGRGRVDDLLATLQELQLPATRLDLAAWIGG